VWTLYDEKRWDLLEAVIKPDDLENTCALIVLDMEKPWELDANFKKWMKALSALMFELTPKMKSKGFQSM